MEVRYGFCWGIRVLQGLYKGFTWWGGLHVVFRVLQGLYQVVGFRAVGALGA